MGVERKKRTHYDGRLMRVVLVSGLSLQCETQKLTCAAALCVGEF